MVFVGSAIGGAGLMGLGVLGAGVAGAGASMYAANKTAGIQSDAAKAAAAQQQQGLQFQKDVYGNQKANYDTASGNLNPFIQSGQGANNLLSSMYGTNGTSPALGQSALTAFQNSPDYQFALKGGSAALDNSAASKGGLMGGNQIRAQTEYGQGLATQNLQGYLQRLQGMSQQGSNAGYQSGALGVGLGNGAMGAVGTSSNNIGNSLMAAGTAQGAGINGMVGGFNNGVSQLSLYNQMNKSSYNPGGNNNSGGSNPLNITGSLY